MAACQFAGKVRLKLDEAIDFALVHWIRLGMALVLPLVLAGVLALVIVLLGLLMLMPLLDMLGGLAYGLALGVGFILSFVLIGYASAFGLLLPAVACENCDGPDAGQKAISFIYLRPLHVFGYVAVGFIGLMLGYLVVSLFAAVILNTTAGLFGWLTNQPATLSGTGGVQWLDLTLGDVDPWAGRVSSGLIMFWQTVLVCLVSAYVVSYFTDVATRIFLLLRRSCDDQAVEEIWWPGMAPGTIATFGSRRRDDL